MTAYWCEQAWLPEGGPGPASRVVPSVRVETSGGRIVAVRPGELPSHQDVRLRGLVLPGLADAHSHAFHRALRGRTHSGGGSFWTWREGMYALATALTPERYERLARAVFAELSLGGTTAVGEFHYVHHRADGTPHPQDPNAMAEALRAAARDAGVHLTLLDTCYLHGGLGPGGHEPLAPEQARFGDGSVERWAARVDALRTAWADDDRVRVGAAAHSVRAVAPDELAAVARWAREAGAPLHVHLSEQPGENEAALAAFGRTPTRLLHDAGALGPGTTVVHAVHLTDDDVALLGGTRTGVCLCPVTERDLADGIAPGRRLADAGSPLSVGTDQHVGADVLAEARGVEEHERLATGRRGTFDPAALVDMASAAGHAALGRPDAGRIVAGAPADLVAVRLDTVRTAGADPAQAVLVAGAGDVSDVVAGGDVVVRDGVHRVGDVARLLAEAIEELWAAAREITKGNDR
ncbi:formimidoylglutamate deiminase [Promicromonospora thailandica]|uniref:Formiminoglutamate deiminase n=1 Tax=Promicromonospora thailandica TaxID=765201 RepID=A0A9X2G1N9_9MICO|nr:formimidoylglutamate deiminase [Promicromonospora thailandica]MCP2264260.1 formiminoglutamate deiminase [Promicromonospora thailandica]BFF21061.1 formimidoylglutamate deiminase [Promicromonospora thailandica]